MRNVLITALIMSLSASALLGGCGAKDESSVTKDGKIKLRFATWDSAENLDMQQELVDRFNTGQDHITVALEAYGSEYDTKISAGMGSGDTPDVMYMWDYPSYYKGLEPLDSYIEKEGEQYKENFYDALWDYNMINGSYYGIPAGFTTHCLYFNKDIFDQAGLEYPTGDWTWDDVTSASRTIIQKVDGVKGLAFSMKPDPYDYEMYLWSNGTAYMDGQGNLKGSLNSEKSAQVLEFFQDMEKEGIAAVTEKNGSDEMKSGKAAMFIYGSWALGEFTEQGLNYGVAEIPSFKGSGQKSVSVLSSSGIAMSKDSKYKEAAWEFIKYWTGEELNLERISYELPVLNTVVESENIMSDPLRAPFYTMLERSAGYTPASFISGNWSALKDQLSLAFERVFNPSALEAPMTVLNEAVGDLMQG